MIYLFAFGWWLLGFSSLIYWCTKHSDAETKDVIAAVFLGGPLGPLSWFMGWVILGDEIKFSKKVFFKRREP